MAKINWQDIGELQGADQNSINKAIVIPAKEALRQVRFALTGNLTIRDNAYAAIVTLGYSGNSTQTLTNGTEYTFQNPLKTKPIGFTPIIAVNENGLALSVPSCIFNTSRTDGLIGVTPFFIPQFGLCGLARSTTQSAAHNTLTSVQWDVERILPRGELSHSNTVNPNRITCASDGFVRVSWQLAYAPLAAVLTNRFGGLVRRNGASAAVNSRWASTIVQSAGTDDTASSSAIIPVSADDYIELMAFQANTLAAARDIIGGTAQESRIDAEYIYPATAFSGILTGILWGG